MALRHVVISNGCEECGEQYAGDDTFYWSDYCKGPICETCGRAAMDNDDEQEAKD